MSFTYNKRMSNYQAMLPLTPNNYHIARHTIRGGDLTATPALQATPATPATPTLPETVQDWQNMSNAEILQLTPADINNLTDASFTMAFTSTAPLDNSISGPIYSNYNSPNHSLMVTAINNRRNLLRFWVSPNDPKLKAQLEGVPSFWLQHPNQYIGAKSQNVMYSVYQDFQGSSFYTKYSSRIKAITPPRKFARYMNSETPGNERNSMGSASSLAYLDDIIAQYGQKWRVMFFQGDLSGQMTSGNDYYVYYIDSTGLPDYLDMLQEFYNDRDVIQPEEVVVMLGDKYQAILRQKLAQIEAQDYSTGYSTGHTAGYSSGHTAGYSEGDAAGKVEGAATQQEEDEAAQQAKDEAAKEASSDSSSSIWGDIGEGLEVAAAFI